MCYLQWREAQTRGCWKLFAHTEMLSWCGYGYVSCRNSPPNEYFTSITLASFRNSSTFPFGWTGAWTSLPTQLRWTQVKKTLNTVRLRFASEIFAGVNSYHLGSYAAIVVMPKVCERKETEAQVIIPHNFCTFCFLFQLRNYTVKVFAPPFAFHLCFNMLERCCVRWSAERKQTTTTTKGVCEKRTFESHCARMW